MPFVSKVLIDANYNHKVDNQRVATKAEAEGSSQRRKLDSKKRRS